MNSRERVMAALLRTEIPDRVPWVEMEIDREFQKKVMNSDSFSPDEFAARLGLDAIGYNYPSGLSLDFFPPIFAQNHSYKGVNTYGAGLIKSRQNLSLLKLPDPKTYFNFKTIKQWFNKRNENLAVFARIRFGCISTIISMGLENFALSLVEDVDLIQEIFYQYSKWCSEVIDLINSLPFDFYFVAEDLGFNKGPLMPPQIFKKLFYPTFKVQAQKLAKPWILHSDGNILPLLDDLLPLGFCGLHPIDPSGMDLGYIKRRYGTKICLIGNIDIRYTLTRGTPDEVEKEVYEKIKYASKGGGYILSSANCITNYCKIENIFAMHQALNKYGEY